MDLRSTSNHEKPFDPPAISAWGGPSGLRPAARRGAFQSAGLGRKQHASFTN
jgi:hypothetical protein